MHSSMSLSNFSKNDELNCTSAVQNNTFSSSINCFSSTNSSNSNFSYPRKHLKLYKNLSYQKKDESDSRHINKHEVSFNNYADVKEDSYLNSHIIENKQMLSKCNDINNSKNSYSIFNIISGTSEIFENNNQNNLTETIKDYENDIQSSNLNKDDSIDIDIISSDVLEFDESIQNMDEQVIILDSKLSPIIFKPKSKEVPCSHKTMQDSTESIQVIILYCLIFKQFRYSYQI